MWMGHDLSLMEEKAAKVSNPPWQKPDEWGWGPRPLWFDPWDWPPEARWTPEEAALVEALLAPD